MKQLLLYLISLTLIGCSSDTSDQEGRDNYEASVFMSPETSEFLGRPLILRADSQAIHMFDRAYKQLYKVDHQGNKLLAIDRQGPGPGEYENIVKFWATDEHYIVHDFNSAKFVIYHREDGEHVRDFVIEENPIHAEASLPSFDVTTTAINSHQMLTPSEGKDGTLFAFVDLEADTLQYYGEALGDYVGYHNPEAIRESYMSGEIPDLWKNAVLLGSSDSAIYSFQLKTGILEKYSYSGERQWKKSVKVPEQEGMFEHFIEENRKKANAGENPPYTYVHAFTMEVTEEGVAINLKMPPYEEHPVTVVWISSDGSHVEELTYTGVDPDQLIGGNMAISSNESTIYFLHPFNSEILKAEWPF